MPRGASTSQLLDSAGTPETPPALCRVVLQLHSYWTAPELLRHHRLYAVWCFNFTAGTTPEMSFKTPPALRRVVFQLHNYWTAPAFLRHHRLYAVWCFNFTATGQRRNS